MWDFGAKFSQCIWCRFGIGFLRDPNSRIPGFVIFFCQKIPRTNSLSRTYSLLVIDPLYPPVLISQETKIILFSAINNNYIRKDPCSEQRKSLYRNKEWPRRVAPNIRYEAELNCSQPQIPQEKDEKHIFNWCLIITYSLNVQKGDYKAHI